ncbi:DUF4160 domain-containing protein [candidate division KSB1 bacterium]|nr:DUF4160 domain-containing protein [candidate division KSB1 bacterium]
MYPTDHPPPHFHAEYGEYEALIAIDNSEIIAGSLPARAFHLVKEWLDIHRDELEDLWQIARQSMPLHKLDTLE